MMSDPDDEYNRSDEGGLTERRRRYDEERRHIATYGAVDDLSGPDELDVEDVTRFTQEKLGHFAPGAAYEPVFEEPVLLVEPTTGGSLSDGAYKPANRPALRPQVERRLRVRARRQANRRPTRQTKARRDSIEMRAEAQRITAYCITDEYKINDIVHMLEDEKWRGSLSIYDNALHCQQTIGQQVMDIFIFDYGCLVCWAMPDAKAEEDLIAKLVPFQGATVYSEWQGMLEEFTFVAYPSENNFSIDNDEFCLAGTNVLEKLSVSFAMGQAVKLNAFEERLGVQIGNSRKLPRLLATEGVISLSAADIDKKIGELLMDTHEIFLESDVLETPDFLWKEDLYKTQYDRTHEYLEVKKRVDILNARLEHLKELFNLLREQQTLAHGTRLEYIIIILICLEVIFQSLH
eukprot:g63256.t1